MPYLQLQVTPAITREQKAELVARFTAALVDVLGKKPEHIHVVIQELAEENWGFAGKLTDEIRGRVRKGGVGGSDTGKPTPPPAGG